MQLSADERQLYFVSGGALFAWTFVAATAPSLLTAMPAIDPRLQAADAWSGYDAWDRAGRFYLAGFARVPEASSPLWLVRVDPVRIKVALGWLPALTSVSLRLTGDAAELSREGDVSTALPVWLAVDGASPQIRSVILAAGANHILLRDDYPELLRQHRLRVLPDGDTYVAD
jgi:hypothetical protein